MNGRERGDPSGGREPVDGNDPAERDESAGRRDPTEPAEPADEQAILAELVERETAYGLLQRARSLSSKRHFAQATVLLERAARLEPGKGSIVEALARAHFNGGRPEEAAVAFGELLEIDPSSAYAHYGLGRSLRRLGRMDEALEHLRVAAALAPHSRLYRRVADKSD